MKKSNQIIVHIGLPKTGTSFLQVDVFPLIKQVSVLRGWDNFRKMIDLPAGNRILISDEFFACQMTKGSLISQLENRMDRIKEIFVNPSIIVGFREQKEFVLSYYKQHLHAGGTRKLDDVFNLENTGLLKIEDLNYSNWLKVIDERFSDVMVYTNRSIKENLQGFVDEVCSKNQLETFDCKQIKQKSRNVGVRSVRQVEYLLEKNKSTSQNSNNISTKIKRKLQGKNYKTYLNKALEMEFEDGDELFKLPGEVVEFINEKFSEDWSQVQNRITF